MNRKLGGLYKRCGCPRAKWDRCHSEDHPWYHHYKAKGVKRIAREVIGVMMRGDAKIKQEARRKALRDQATAGQHSDGRMILDDVVKAFAIGRPRNSYLGVLCRLELPTVRLGSKRIKDVSVSDLLDAVEAYKKTAQKRAAGGQVGIRKLMQTARHLWNWSLDTDKTDRSPF
jgi:hypothetical protein